MQVWRVQGKTRYEIFAAGGLFARFYPPANISEPIVQGEAAFMGRRGWKKCTLKVLKSQNHGNSGVRRVKEPDSVQVNFDDFKQLFDKKRANG